MISLVRVVRFALWGLGRVGVLRLEREVFSVSMDLDSVWSWVSRSWSCYKSCWLSY